MAAVQNGCVVNYSKIAKDVGCDYKSVQNYYSILENTLLGFHLDAFHTSIPKRLRKAPKFYFVDTGVARALANQLSIGIHESTSYFGDLFEQFVVNEIYRKNSYTRSNFKLSYLCTEAGVEIDLVVERPGRPIAFVEIKSTKSITEDQVSSLAKFTDDFEDAAFYCFSRDPVPKQWGAILASSWTEGLVKLFE